MSQKDVTNHLEKLKKKTNLQNYPTESQFIMLLPSSEAQKCCL